jgi:hypothetical protein
MGTSGSQRRGFRRTRTGPGGVPAVGGRGSVLVPQVARSAVSALRGWSGGPYKSVKPRWNGIGEVPGWSPPRIGQVLRDEGGPCAPVSNFCCCMVQPSGGVFFGGGVSQAAKRLQKRAYRCASARQRHNWPNAVAIKSKQVARSALVAFSTSKKYSFSAIQRAVLLRRSVMSGRPRKARSNTRAAARYLKRVAGMSLAEPVHSRECLGS